MTLRWRTYEAAKDLGIRKEEQLENVLQYHEGMLLLRKGDYERAIESLQLLVSKGVQSEALDTALGMAVLLMLPKNAPDEKSPERQIVIRAGRAEHDSLLKKTDDAKKEYLALTQEFPDFPNVHYSFGRFLLTIQRYGRRSAGVSGRDQTQPNAHPCTHADCRHALPR